MISNGAEWWVPYAYNKDVYVAALGGVPAILVWCSNIVLYYYKSGSRTLLVYKQSDHPAVRRCAPSYCKSNSSLKVLYYAHIKLPATKLLTDPEERVVHNAVRTFRHALPAAIFNRAWTLRNYQYVTDRTEYSIQTQRHLLWRLSGYSLLVKLV